MAVKVVKLEWLGKRKERSDARRRRGKEGEDYSRRAR